MKSKFCHELKTSPFVFAYQYRAKRIVSDVLTRAFGNQRQPQDRSSWLVCMWFRQLLEQPMLEDYRIYWEHYSDRIVCFADISRFVGRLTWPHRQDLLLSIQAHLDKSYDSKVSHVSLRAGISRSDIVMH